MKLPSRNRNWLREIQKAYSAAERQLSSRKLPIEEVYMLAPELAARNRAISDKKLVHEMTYFIDIEVKRDWDKDPKSQGHYKFHFVSAYLYSHLVPKLISENECEKIMDYVNKNWELFENA